MDSKEWIGFQILRKMKKRMVKRHADSDLEEISVVESLEYDFITIQNATNNFSDANKIGGGSFGVVYKGTLEDGERIAVKKLSENLMEYNPEFKNEVALMAKLQHRNLLRLLGYCQEGRKTLLVYEFVPNGGLDNILLDPIKREFLDWKRRYKIIESIARGLIYLHEDCLLRMIHYNLKASNVLLDADLNPKIADFDIARLFVLDKTHGSTSKILGTDSYMAPEYVLQGEISVKSNVYGFGVLVLEIISGQKIASCQTGESINDLLSYAWTHWKHGSASNFIDQTLRGICPVHEITKCIHIALLCVQENVADRPKMGEVLQMLSDLSMSLPVPLPPGSFIHGSTSSEGPSQFTKNAKSISDQYHRRGKLKANMQKRKAKSYVKKSSSSDAISRAESHLKYELINIRSATDNFSEANKLGAGCFGPVYKGKLENGQLVAVMRLSLISTQGSQEFKNEVVLMARLQHRNLVRLLGYCQEGIERLLVYEFVPSGGLDKFLFDPVKRGYLDWGRCYKIIESIGKGLVYLHEDSRLRIVHRNLNASNVLLDADLNPKIADFGLAWFFALDETQGSTNRVVGTYGYMAPEYALDGRISIRSDVYSFGVLVLEIISGRRNTNFLSGEKLIGYAWTHWNGGSASNVIDPMLRGVSSPVDDIIKCIQVALLCVQTNAEDRPTMSQVVQMLSNLSMSFPVPSDPNASFNWLPSFHSSSNSEASINGMSISDDDEYLR